MNGLYRANGAARKLGISKATLLRWEKRGLILQAKRNYQNYRVYSEEDIKGIRESMRLDVLSDPNQ